MYSSLTKGTSRIHFQRSVSGPVAVVPICGRADGLGDGQVRPDDGRGAVLGTVFADEAGGFGGGFLDLLALFAGRVAHARLLCWG